MAKVKVIEGINETPHGEEFYDISYFVGKREIDKPKLLETPVGKYVAISEFDSRKRKYLFSKDDIADVKNMEIIKTPDWVLAEIP